MRKLTAAQKRLLSGLDPHGGIFDRWIRVLAQGEVLTTATGTTALTAFRYGYILMDGDRVVLTDKGREALKENAYG